MAWNGSQRNEGKVVAQKMRKGFPHSIVVSSIVLSLVGAAVVFLMSSKNDTPPERPFARPIETPNVDKIQSRKLAHRKPVKTVQDGLDNIGDFDRPEIVTSKVACPAFQLSSEDWNRLTNRVFKTGSEQLMSWVFTCELGMMPPPLPKLTKEERDTLPAVLISKNQINSEDNERVAAAKAIVDVAKREMMKFIKQGGDPDDFLRYYHEELNRAFEYRNLAIDQIAEVAETDGDLARELGQKINEKLASEGIKTINIETIIPEGENTSHETE